MTMTAPKPVDEDGNLPEARRLLGDAIAKLIDPRPEVHDGGTVWVDSFYTELVDACPGEQGRGHSIPKSTIPFWIDAVELRNEIDTAVSAWEPRPPLDVSVDNPLHITVLRLQAIDARKWKPSDVHSIEQIVGIVESWVAAIKSLLTPTANWTLPNPCPSCGVKVVYRKDSAGDTVRKPALEIGPEGCTCLNCRYTWGPLLFTHLARVLGTLPPGVLE